MAHSGRLKCPDEAYGSADYWPDDSPTGKLIAAALELGERAKKDPPWDNPSEPDGDGYRDAVAMWVAWEETDLLDDLLIEIHREEADRDDL